MSTGINRIFNGVQEILTVGGDSSGPAGHHKIN